LCRQNPVLGGPFEAGVVRAIHVHDGQSVKAGDVLIELDPTMAVAERDHIRSDLIAAQLDVARLRAVLSDADDAQNAFAPPAGASSELIVMQRQFLSKQVEEYRAKFTALDRQRAQKEAETSAVAASIDKFEALATLHSTAG
jgi:hemolysin D